MTHLEANDLAAVTGGTLSSPSPLPKLGGQPFSSPGLPPPRIPPCTPGSGPTVPLGPFTPAPDTSKIA